jgi:DDE superfamily endonuclease/Helix-turn-helix of DDE superfamily endonuclease
MLWREWQGRADHEDVSSAWARAALSHPICTGISRDRLAALIAELAEPWQGRCESALRVRRGGRDRRRAPGAGPNRMLPFIDRVIATLVALRFQLPHAALAVFYRVDRSTITRAVHEVRPLLAQRGFAVPGRPGVRLHTLADVFAYAAAEGVHLRIDGTEVQVRRPRANKPGRRVFVSGKKKQNTIKPTAIGDGAGRLLWLGAFRPGRMHDVTALRTEGVEDLLQCYPQVGCEVDSGYPGLARDYPGQVTGPPKKPGRDASADDLARWETQRKNQSSRRICIEHAIAEPKKWRPLQRYLGRREYFQQTALAIAGLVSDRCTAR